MICNCNTLVSSVGRAWDCSGVVIPGSPVQSRNGGFVFYRYKAPHGNFESLYTT